ncbi:DDE-domain-containing protein [Sanghuangporus baumii]|uniref:DDE-domain-containing protein n=1 Tax=Sanghuangporus baumii TaxID=108892 RepID=A0A9Q5HUW2_SANBA|nr:DDE-domain-containing protein [Sanghuangporus baumii]
MLLMPSASTSYPANSGSPDPLNEEARVQEAVSAMLASGLNTENQHYHLSISQAAIRFGVSRFIIAQRLKGISDRRTAHQHQQNLSPSQETVLVEWAKSLGRCSIPLTRITLREKVEMITGHALGDT